MFNNSKLASSVKLALALGVALSTVPVYAEEQDDSSQIEKIAVTGSRIAKPELSQPTPIVSLGADEIAKFGNTDLASILAELPAVGATDTIIGNNNSNENAGLSSADLRRLGLTVPWCWSMVSVTLLVLLVLLKWIYQQSPLD